MPHSIKYKRLVIIGKYKQAIKSEALLELLTICYKCGYFILIEQKTALINELIQAQDKTGFIFNNIPFNIIELEHINTHSNLDFAIVIGGDGTMIGVARKLCIYDIPLIGINSGKLGFITDINFNQIQTSLNQILQGEYFLDKRTILKAKVMQKGKIACQALAINDVVINRHLANGMIEFAIYVDDIYMCKQRADGLIISTATGSTAYSLSVGGPVLHPNTAGIILAPIAPHTLSNRPIVIPVHSHIKIKICGDKECMVNFDMQSYTNLQYGDEIHIQESSHKLIFAHHKEYDYYNVLRKKLHWQEECS